MFVELQSVPSPCRALRAEYLGRALAGISTPVIVVSDLLLIGTMR